MKDRYELDGYSAVPAALKDLCERRIRPFLDRGGLATRSLERLMSEAYLQGMKDAADAMVHKPA